MSKLKTNTIQHTGGSADNITLDNSQNVTVENNLTANGKILIGTTTTLGSNADDLNIKTTGNTGISIQSGTSSAGNIYFADGTSGTDLYRGFISYNHSGDALSLGTANTTNLSIDSFGNVEVENGNLIIGTAGKGIDFSATSNASAVSSEVLDTYEEGLWTPTLLDGNGSNTTINVTSNATFYRRIGDLVHVFFVIEMADTGKTGIMKVRTLPFDVLRFVVSGTWWLDEGGPSSGDSVGGSVYCHEGDEELRFVHTTSDSQNAGHRYLEFGDWTNGRPMYGSATYITS